MPLYAVYLGGDLAPGRMGEDHEVVFVVGEDLDDVRRRAKAKWKGMGRAHVDAVERLDRIDGHEIRVVADPSGVERAGDVTERAPEQFLYRVSRTVHDLADAVRRRFGQASAGDGRSSP